MTDTLRPVTIAGATLTEGYHTCALFDDADDEDAVLLPFARDAIEAGERLVMIVSPADIETRRRWLAAAGLDVDGLAGSHQLELLGWDQTYVREGRFDQDLMLDLVRDTFTESRELGFPRTRVVGHMEWRLDDPRGVDQLLEYEARCNGLLDALRQPAICVYRIDRFDARTLIDVIRTHRVVVMGRTFRENPFFSLPAAFLEEHAGAHG